MADQGPPSPIQTDMGEQAVLDLVPLAGPWGKMADRDGDSQGISQGLQFDFPQTDPIAIAAATIGADQQLLGLLIERVSHLCPPTPNALRRKARSIMITAHVDPPQVPP